MSVVTNAILYYDSAGEAFLAKVNEFFRGRKGFVSVKDPALPDAWYGGDRRLEVDLAIGAFNHLDLEGLVQHLRQIGGPYAVDFQLMVREQDEERFRIINIVEDVSATEPGDPTKSPDG